MFSPAEIRCVRGVRRPDHQQPVDTDLGERGGELELTLGVVSGVADQGQVIARPGFHFDAPHELTEQGQREVGNQQSDLPPAPRPTQRAGTPVRPVVQIVDRTKHLGPQQL